MCCRGVLWLLLINRLLKSGMMKLKREAELRRNSKSLRKSFLLCPCFKKGSFFIVEAGLKLALEYLAE